MHIIKITLILSLLNLHLYKISKAQSSFSEIGVASYYGIQFHGKKTASGDIYNMNELTAAHNSLPFNTYVKVTSLKNNQSVIVRINDRGPYSKNRIIDLSKAAAERIHLITSGIAKVKIEVVNPLEKKDPEELENNGTAYEIGKLYTVSGKEINGKGYGIQLGSFSDEKKLNMEAGKLVGKTKNLYIETAEVNGQMAYRIIYGWFSNKQSAIAELKKVKQSGYKGFIRKFN